MAGRLWIFLDSEQTPPFLGNFDRILLPISLVFLGFSRANRDFSKGYEPCAPAKKYFTLLIEVIRRHAVKPPVTRRIANVLITAILTGILIFSKEMVSTENAIDMN